jgi:HlyD family secretion protein
MQGLTTIGKYIGRRAWRRHGPSVLVWLAALGGVVYLLGRRTYHFEATGIAQGDIRQIAAATLGRIRFVPVRLFENVRQGQTLTVLEDDRIQCDLATASAEIARLRAELHATQDRLDVDARNRKIDRMTEARRFATDVENARIRILDLTTILETDRTTLDDLRLKMKFTQNIFSKEAATDFETQTARINFAALERKIRENERELVQARLDLEQSKRRNDDFVKQTPAFPSLDLALAPLREAVTVQERRVTALAMDRAMLVLKSPLDGTVSQMIRGVGEAVRPGEPILVVSARRASSIVAYASDFQIGEIKEGMPVELITQAGGGRIVGSKVVSVGPVIEQIPVRLWRNPSIPEWARGILVAVPTNLNLVPSELIVIRR